MSQPIPIPLVAGFANRFQSLTEDPKLINAFAERGGEQNEVFIYKRPGFRLYSGFSFPAGTARMLYNWKGALYAVIGDKLYKNGATVIGTVAAGGGNFTAQAGLSATPKLFLHNSTNGYTVLEDGTFAEVTDTDFPPKKTPAEVLVPGAPYLNGTFYVMNTASRMVNSEYNQDDPASWEAAFLDANNEGNDAVALYKQLTFIVAFKQYFTEAFYDAGNPAPGSPLAPVSGAKMNFGLFSASSLANCGGELVFVAQTTEGSYSVVRLSNLSPDPLSTPAVERVLETSDLSSLYSWSARAEGHRFYGLTAPLSNWTLVYDLTSQLWYQWKDTNDNHLPYAFSSIGPSGRAIFLHATSGKLYELDALTYRDDSLDFSVEVYAPSFERNLQTKILPRMDFLGDRVPGSTLDVRWSDDDYRTWSPYQTVDLSLERPGLADLGSFFRRAFHLKHRSNTPFRLERAVLYTAEGT